jgi:hypothetical protein
LATLTARLASELPIRDYAAASCDLKLVGRQIRQFTEFVFVNGAAVYCAAEEIG